ncbi:MAG TPA: type II secretion system F family protein [Polyangia bacterium]|nr:type II secretion system F family protein [Polyangia bacterium]
MTNLLIGVGVLAVVALIEGLYYAVNFLTERQREELRRRLQTVAAGEGTGRLLMRQGRLAADPAIDAVLRELPIMQRLGDLMEEAQSSATVARLLVTSAALAAAGALVGLILRAPLAALVLGAAGAMCPTIRLRLARDRRDQKLTEQLPAALDMIARSLRAGHALTAAFKLVASEMPGPINVEFARAYEEQNLGVSFEKAVLQMVRRAPRNRDLKIFAVSVIIQGETGGNLVEILEKLADTIRGRFRFYEKAGALAAEGKLSGLVLGLLPIVTGGVMTLINSDYVGLLITSALGKGILLCAMASWFVGVLWLRQMAKVEL